MSALTRRELLLAAAGLSDMTLAIGTSATGTGVPNESTGSARIELYTNVLSVVAGETVTVHVSTTARHFDLQVARVGLVDSIVLTQSKVPGAFHDTPDDAWQRGCQWPVAAHFEVPTNWKSGYYQIKAIIAEEGLPSIEALAFVVVRASIATSKTLLVLTTSTYGAYNDYGGASLYVRKGTGRGGSWGDDGEHQVSFQRPWPAGFLAKPEDCAFEALLARGIEFDPKRLDEVFSLLQEKGISIWSYAAGFDNWERKFVRWLERNGYQVDYAISSDLEFHPDLLPRYRLMVSAGHDEYWSWHMRDGVEAFIGRGGNVCFFSGDVCTWQVRYADGGSTMVCYKHDYKDDPLFDSGERRRTATFWSSHFVNRPETTMTGLSFWYGGVNRHLGTTPRGPRGYLVYRPDHWIFRESGLGYGDLLGDTSTIVHFELVGCPIRMEYGVPFPAVDHNGPASLEILGMVPTNLLLTLPPVTGAKPEDQNQALLHYAKEIFGNDDPKTVRKMTHNHAVMSIYSNKGTVFCAGTTDWVMGLTGKDPAVERVTKNLLDRLST